MHLKSSFGFAILSFSLLTMSVDSVWAGPKSNDVKAAAKNISLSIRKFNRKFGQLSATDKASILKFLQSNSTFVDSDSDGLPDIAEGGFGAGVCNSDSDHNGISDGQESEDGSDPTGHELEFSGLVTAIGTDGSITIDTHIFSLTDTTQFKKITKSTIAVGSCLEVKAHLVDGTTTVVADRVKADDSCGGGDDNSGEDGGHHGSGEDSVGHK